MIDPVKYMISGGIFAIKVHFCPANPPRFGYLGSPQPLMGLFDPSKEDLREEKKPRFRQDLVTVVVILGMLLVYLLLELTVI